MKAQTPTEHAERAISALENRIRQVEKCPDRNIGSFKTIFDEAITKDKETIEYRKAQKSLPSS